MKNKRYFSILVFCFSLIFIYELLRIFILSPSTLLSVIIEISKVLIVIFILAFETIQKKKIYRIINFSFFLLAAIAIVICQFDPRLGFLIFLGSLLPIIVLLFANAFKSKENRLEKIMILIFPASHYIWIYTQTENILIPWWPIDIAAIGLTAIFLWIKLLK